MRCAVCGRAPTDEEQIEMFVNFGHKLKDKPLRYGETLVWDCKQCSHDVGVDR
jgi:hypothetical protein